MIPNSKWAIEFVGTYPPPNCWSGASTEFAQGKIRVGDLFRIANLWLTEGIPFVFRDAPLVYEQLRELLGIGFKEGSYAVTLTGSARLGYSLKPGRFPKEFIPVNSDLDCIGVSSSAFGRLVEEFGIWNSMFRTKRIQPKDAETRYWTQNTTETPRDISRGFIDTIRIPNREPFPFTRFVNNRRFLAKRHLEINGIPVRAVNLRVYNDWASVIAQVAKSLEAFVRSDQHSAEGNEILRNRSGRT